MSEPKKKRTRIKDSHRWTDQQTIMLLQLIVEALSKEDVKFEQPTSQKFYTNHCKHSLLDGIDWSTMKSKMRYLKSTYIKAISWRERVGSELFQSDKGHIEARIKTICPYYAQLNSIFETMMSTDPIRLTEKDFNNYLPTVPLHDENDLSLDTSDLDDSEYDSFRNVCSRIIPKEEFTDLDDPSLIAFGETTSVRRKRNREILNFSVSNGTSSESFDKNPLQTPSDEEESPPCYKSQFELECARLNFEHKKFEMELQYRQSKKTIAFLQLGFEKRKFFEEQKLRKYEIDKQFEAKKLAIEKDERLQRLQLEYKYRFKSNSEVVDYD